MIKIVVAVKRVVDANIKVRLNEAGELDISGFKKAMNPFDEIALEQAVQMKEKGLADEAIAVSVGDSGSSETLRTALAMGADRAVFLETEKDVIIEPLNVAKLLAAFMKKEAAGLMIFGKQAIDNDANQVGQMVAAMLDLPQATHVSKVEEKDGKLHVTREIDGGIEEDELELPAVVTADLRLSNPRYVTLPMMMKSKKKPMQVVPYRELGVELRSHLELIKVESPEVRKTGQILSSVDELIDKLKNEVKVL